jgi:transmembrane sensor
MNQQGSEQFDNACDAALGWIARLRSDAVSEQDHQSFALWLGEDNCHRQAMDQMLELWDDLGVVRKLPIEDSPPREAANSSRWAFASAALAACLVVAVFLWPQLGNQPVASQYQTAKGERSSIELPDGSIARLNTESSISVTYTDKQRHISLLRGEAWFQVAPNKQRPFHVDAGEARVTALGTAFNVYLKDGSTDVTVTEGVVRVSELGETGARAPSTEVLRVNQKLIVGNDGWQVSSVTDSAGPLAWQRGELVAQEMPLPELLEQLERYHPTEILIADPDLAVLTVSGVFQLDQPQATLHALELSLGIQADTVNATTIRLLKADQ